MTILFKKLIKILEPADKIKLLALFILMLVEALLEVFSIGMVAAFISIVDNPSKIFNIEWLKPALSFLEIKTSREILIYGSIFLILIFLLKNIYLLIFKYLKIRFVYKRYKSISNRLFSLYMEAPYTFHLNHNSANLIRNVSTEAYFLAEKVMVPILNIATEGIMTFGIIILLIYVQPTIALTALILLGVINVLFLKTTRNRMSRYGKKALGERSEMIKIVGEGVGGFKDATIMNRQPWFLKRFRTSINNLSRAQIFRQTSKNSIRPIMETITISGMLLVTLFLLWQGHSVSSLISILALFALSINRLLPAINSLIGEYTELKYHAYAIDPIYSDLNQLTKQNKNLKKNGDNNRKKMSFSKNIQLKDISYSYPNSKEQVLKNISLMINKGSVVGFVGVTGSGKTTLADLILGLLKPKRGIIKVDNIDIQENLRGWQKNIGYIPQSIYLSDDTIRNNIAFGLSEEEIDKKQLNNAVKIAQLDEFVKHLPKGLNTVIGERGVRLSGGQRQRIGIARSLYHNPEVLVMDEATSSLDTITEKFVIKAIESLKRKLTIIIIAHRLTTVKSCDTLFLIKDGKLVIEGSYNELLKKNKEFNLMAQSSK
jgi:ATP-binding cassette, subfamily B, bacterial PglK